MSDNVFGSIRGWITSAQVTQTRYYQAHREIRGYLNCPNIRLVTKDADGVERVSYVQIEPEVARQFAMTLLAEAILSDAINNGDVMESSRGAFD